MYISDYFMGMSGALACAGQNLRLITSLDHAGWIHDYSFRPNDWLLYERNCDYHSHNRSLTRGRLWTQDRRLIMSTIQETLIMQESAENDQIPAKL